MAILSPGSNSARKASVNPADEPVVRAAQEELLARLEEGSLKIAPTDKVERGGAIIRTERGEVDARLRVQFEILGEVLERAAAGEELPT